MSISDPHAGSWLTEPNRRQFLALAATLAASPLLGAAPFAQRGKTLVQYKTEANAYASALSALSAAPSSIATYRSAAERLGANLRHRVSWLVAQVAQDSRLADALKPHFASQAAFNRFTTTVAASATGIVNLPGVRQAAADAIAKDTQNRLALKSAVRTFAALMQKEATRLQTRVRDEDLNALLSKAEDSESVRLAEVVALVAVAVVVASIAMIVATFSVGGSTAVSGATLATIGATTAIASVAVAAAGARIAAAAVTSAAETAAAQAGASADAIAACVDAAAARRASCLSALSGTPAEREYQAAMCQANYLAQSGFCSITA